MTYLGVAKGKVIELTDPLPFPDGQIVQISSIEPINTGCVDGRGDAIRAALRRSPAAASVDVDMLEEAIERGRLPLQDHSEFDSGEPN